MQENISFPVDLNREEFIAYYDLSARTACPLRGHRGRLILTGVLAALLTGAFLYQYAVWGEWDLPMLLLTAGLVLLALFTGLYLPRRLRRQAARLYEETMATGYDYYGTVTVHSAEIVKQGQEVTTTIPLDQTTFFVETADMQLFIHRQGRALVLPARCMTSEAAAAVRTAADRLPTANRRFVARLQAQGLTPTPSTGVPAVTVWDKTVRYTAEELTAVLQGRVRSAYGRRIPSICGMSLLAGLIYGWGQESVTTAMIACGVCFGLLTLFTFLLPYRRASRIPEDTHQTVQVTLTDRGVQLREGEQFAAFPWRAVRHVYDRGDHAEMLFPRGASLYLPKREIGDMAVFEAILGQYWKTNSNNH